MKSKQNRRIAGLDGLRAIAIIGIVLYHLFPEAVPGGFLGVALFFSIMGYLLVYSTRNELADGSFAIGNYYRKKIRRLYPPLLITLLLCALVQIPLWPRMTKGTFSEILSVLLGYNNWWQIAQNSSYFTRIMNASPLTHLWYLSLTVQYYLIWPLLLVTGLMLRTVMKRKGVAFLLFFGALISAAEMALLYAPDADPSRIYYGTDTRMFSLLLGMSLAMYPAERKAQQLRRNRFPAGILFLILTAGTVLLYLKADGVSPYTYRGVMFGANLIFIIMMFLAMGWQKPIGYVLDNPPMKWIGTRSYMIYLLMYPVIYFFHQFISKAEDLPMKLASLAVILILAEGLWRMDRSMSAKPDVTDMSRRQARAAVQAKQVLTLLQNVALALCVLLVSFAQTRVFESSHDTSDLELLEKELQENAAMMAEQSDMIYSAQPELTAEAMQTPETSPAESAAAALPSQTPEPEEIPESVPEETPAEEQGVPQTTEYSAIGDSVMLGAYADMRQELPMIWVDAAQSRHANVGTIVADWLYQNGHLGNTVIVHLGTNSRFAQETGQELIDYIGPDRKIYWLTCHGPSLGYIGAVNETIRALADANPNVTVLDWDALANEHWEWFYSDGIHLNPDGRMGFTRFISEQLGLPMTSGTTEESGTEQG